jgi:hypothetical protein
MSNNTPTPPKPLKPLKDKPKNTKLPKPPTPKKTSMWAWLAIATLAMALIFGSSSLLEKNNVKTIKYSVKQTVLKLM